MPSCYLIGDSISIDYGEACEKALLGRYPFIAKTA